MLRIRMGVVFTGKRGWEMSTGGESVMRMTFSHLTIL